MNHLHRPRAVLPSDLWPTIPPFTASRPLIPTKPLGVHAAAAALAIQTAFIGWNHSSFNHSKTANPTTPTRPGFTSPCATVVVRISYRPGPSTNTNRLGAAIAATTPSFPKPFGFPERYSIRLMAKVNCSMTAPGFCFHSAQLVTGRILISLFTLKTNP